MRLIASFLLVIWSGAAVAQDNEDDRNFITGLIEDAINNDDLTVRLINFQGALSSEATADMITIADPDGVWLQLDDLTLSWNRSALLSGRVEIEAINAARIELIRLPVTSDASADLPGAQAEPFSLPDLPVSVDIADLSADEIVLTDDLLGEPIVAQFVGAIKLGDGAGSTDFTLERTDGKVGRFVVDASYENETRQLGLALLAEEGDDGIAARLLDLPDRPSVRLQINGDAPVVEFAADIALATDNVDRVTGTVVLSRPTDAIDQNFNIDLRGDLRPLLDDEYDPFFGASTVLRVEGSVLGVGGLRLSNLIIAAEQVVLRGSAELDAQGWPASLDLRGRLGNGDGTRVLLPIAGDPIEVSGMSLNVNFDAAQDSAWTGAFDITSLTRAGVSIDVLALSGGGTIIPGAGETRGGFSANLDYAGRGLVLDDAALSEAVGSDLTGNIAVSRTEGGALRISNLSLDGAGLTAQAYATVDGLDGRFETTFDVGLNAADFTRFAALTDLDLGGSGEVVASGSVQPFDGIFDVDLSAITQDLAFGIADVDPLLTGETALSVTAERDEDGTRLRNLRLNGETLSAQGDVTLTGTTATATLSGALADLSRIAPSLSGPAMLSANVDTDEDGVIKLVTTVTAPSARADVDVVATPVTDGYAVRGDGTIRADDLRAYGDLVNQQLGGGVTIDLDGEYMTPTGAASANVSAATRDVSIGNAAVDKIIAGLGRITANVSLSEERRLRLDALDVVFPNLTATGAVASSGTDTTANLSVRL
ncbi:MAG: translocation/assembly module TamB domain-containing protein, partial [Octadecabacter sp.]